MSILVEFKSWDDAVAAKMTIKQYLKDNERISLYDILKLSITKPYPGSIDSYFNEGSIGNYYIVPTAKGKRWAIAFTEQPYTITHKFERSDIFDTALKIERQIMYEKRMDEQRARGGGCKDVDGVPKNQWTPDDPRSEVHPWRLVYKY